jgi:hypothetical protein
MFSFQSLYGDGGRVTEREWQEAVNPLPMLRWLGDRIGAREAICFASSCCARVRPLIRDPRSVQALEVLERAMSGVVDQSTIDVAAEQAQQAAWLAVREFCVPLLGEEEFNRRIKMVRTGPDEFEMMASVDPAYLATEAVRCALLCTSDSRNAEFASRCAAEAIARSHTDVDEARAREWASQAAILRQIAGNVARHRPPNRSQDQPT